MSTVEQFEYVFLGGGKGGKTLAMELAKAGKRVAVVEEGMIGGSCINVACIPSKALLQNARNMHAVHSADILKDGAPDAKVDMTRVHRWVLEVVDGMVEINSKAFEASGFDLILGTGHFVGPRRIQVAMNNGQERVVEGAQVFINTD